MNFLVPIGSCSEKIICDKSDFDELSSHKWTLMKSNHHRYAKGYVHWKCVMAHRFLLRDVLQDGLVVDHINGNGLDNRRSNLRVSSIQQNVWNRRVTHSRTGVAGVSVQGGMFIGRFVNDGKTVYLGSFETLEEAAFHVESAKEMLRGDFSAPCSYDKEKLRNIWTGRIEELKKLLLILEAK